MIKEIRKRKDITKPGNSICTWFKACHGMVYCESHKKHGSLTNLLINTLSASRTEYKKKNLVQPKICFNEKATHEDICNGLLQFYCHVTSGVQ